MPFADNVSKPVTIRSTLLRAFIVVALVPGAILAGLVFVKARQVLQAQIEQSLSHQAETLAADLDKVVVERLQNAAIWSQLDVMQDLKVQDVDRRLSSFLARLREGYGDTYRELSAVDAAGKVIASSDPAMLGRQATPAGDDAVVLVLPGARVALDRPQHDAQGGMTLLIRAPIASHFDETPLGELRLRVDWDSVNAVLDRAALGRRAIAVVDGSGRVIAASRTLRATEAPGNPPQWAQLARQRGAHVFDQTPAGDATAIVGVGEGRAFGGLKWRTLVMEPLDEALEPVHRMVYLALALLGALVLATLVLASWVSRAIAQPIVALTEFTRRYRRDGQLHAVPPGGPGEVGELSAAFVEMMNHIEDSQRNLVRASKLAVVGEMSSIMAHEVRTPLGIIRSSAQMLQREPGLSPEGREMTGFIESETERLNRLVSTLLDSARPRVPVLVPTDVHALIRQCLGLLAGQAAKKKIVFSERLAAADPVVELDAEQITQVLLNLVMNALQILPEGGTVQASTADLGDALEIGIADDGPGIEPDMRERIFEAFFFRREGGVGLGLAIVQQVVQAHRGSIVADQSRLGGAWFRIHLPRHSVPPPP